MKVKSSYTRLALLSVAVINFTGCFEEAATTTTTQTIRPKTEVQSTAPVNNGVATVTSQTSAKPTTAAAAPAPPHSGFHRMICPHAAVISLREFELTDGPSVTKRAKAIAKDSDWIYVKAKEMPVPGLGHNGGTDILRPNNTLFVLAKGAFPMQSTFIAHEHGNPVEGALYPRRGTGLIEHWATKSRPRYEFAPTDEVYDRLAASAFAVVELSGDSAYEKELTKTNTIFFKPENFSVGNDFKQFKAINESFLGSMPAEDRASFDREKTVFLVTARNSNGDDLVVVYRLGEDNEFLVGTAYSLSKANPDVKSRFMADINSIMKSIGRGGRAYHYGSTIRALAGVETNPFPKLRYTEKSNGGAGDPPTRNTSELARSAKENGIEVIRRGSSRVQNFATLDKKLNAGRDIQLVKKNTIFFDGIPTVSSSRFEAEWREHKKNISNFMRDKTARTIATKAELFDELLNGDADVLMMIARKQGSYIAFGNEKVSISEIQNLPSRTDLNSRTKPRIGVFVICEMGIMSEDVSSFLPFGKKFSFPEVLLDKQIFDYVIVPTHKVLLSETEDFVRQYFSHQELFDSFEVHAGNFGDGREKYLAYRKESSDGKTIELFSRFKS